MWNQTIQIKFNESSKQLINGLALYISLIKNNIDDGKNFKITPVDSSIKSNEITFCSDFPFGNVSFNNYLDMESVKTISSSVEMNKYKLLSIRWLDFMYALIKVVTLGYSEFRKYP